MTLADAQQASLVSLLLNAELYSHPVEDLTLIETHISWVILTGPYAYKIKKPIDLGFLDFSSLEQRKFYCEEELRLNRRTAPSIYLDVIPISGSFAAPCWSGGGEAIEYAVKMRQFPQTAQLDRILANHELDSEKMDAFAVFVAEFHQQIAVAEQDSVYGEPEQVLQPVVENFSQIRDRLQRTESLQQLERIEQWSLAEYTQLMPILSQRKQGGFIRECHGDMHLRNLAWVDGKPLAFDCIEFNPNLRWIDVISEVAFLVMDLQDRQQVALAQRFLNRYLEISGDYASLRLLPFYLVYRALVRAKVDAIRLGQKGLDRQSREQIETELQVYLQLAESYTQQRADKLIITHGLSASGKSTLTQPLLEQVGAIRIRSDVERKRLAGLVASESGKAEPGQGIYSKDVTEQTYQRLQNLAAEIIDAGYPVIVDATFLDQRQRDRFRQLATDKEVRFIILDFTAPAEVLRQRIQQRHGDASDADLQVLENQLSHYEDFDASEEPYVISIDTERDTEITLEASS